MTNLLGALFLFAGASTCKATLIGDNVRLVVDTAIGVVYDETRVVDTAVEFAVPGSISGDDFAFDADLDGTSVTFEFRPLSGVAGDYGSSPFNPIVYQFSGLGGAGTAGGLLDVLLSTSTFPTSIAVTFTTDTASFTFADANLFIPLGGLRATFDFVASNMVGVPEPTGLALMVVGLAALGARCTQRR